MDFFFFAKKAYKKGFWTKLNSSHSKLTQIQFKLTIWFYCCSSDLPFHFVNPRRLSASWAIPTLLKYWKLQAATEAWKEAFLEGL